MVGRICPPPPLDEIGLTDISKYFGVIAPPVPYKVPTALQIEAIMNGFEFSKISQNGF